MIDASDNTALNGVTFCKYKFTGTIGPFTNCQFHDCDLSGTRILGLINCQLYSTNLDRADFSQADVRGTITSPGAPCSAYDCEWQGITATLDCGFWAGLKANNADLFLLMALLPQYPDKDKFYRSLPAKLHKEAIKRLGRNFTRAKVNTGIK